MNALQKDVRQYFKMALLTSVTWKKEEISQIQIGLTGKKLFLLSVIVQQIIGARDFSFKVVDATKKRKNYTSVQRYFFLLHKCAGSFKYFPAKSSLTFLVSVISGSHLAVNLAISSCIYIQETISLLLTLTMKPAFSKLH